MAYQHKGVCYETPDSLLQAIAADSQGVTIVDGHPVTYTSVVSGGSVVTTSSLGHSSTYSPTLIDCQLVGMADASMLSGLVVLAWAATYCVVTLRHAVDDTRGS